MRAHATIGWSELRDALADQVPLSNIHLGKRLSHLDQHEDSVTVHFTDASTIDARLVVGADGCFSKVRQHTLNDGLPDFTVSLIFYTVYGLHDGLQVGQMCAICHSECM